MIRTQPPGPSRRDRPEPSTRPAEPATRDAILVVQDEEGRLRARVEGLCEVLADEGVRFRLWLLDAGSVDQTPDVAGDLARAIPQVRYAGSAPRAGLDAAIQGLTDRIGTAPIVLGLDEARAKAAPSTKPVGPSARRDALAPRSEAVRTALRPLPARLTIEEPVPAVRPRQADDRPAPGPAAPPAWPGDAPRREDAQATAGGPTRLRSLAGWRKFVTPRA